MEKCRKLVIVRHGNTFRAGETPTRVGARTDLPLVVEERARSAGRYLREKGIVIDKVISAPLKRTLETANYILEEMNVDLPIIQDLRLKEIDYGPDENMVEDHVIKRLGSLYLEKEGMDRKDLTEDRIVERGLSVIAQWNEKAVVPLGWNVDVEKLISGWQDLAASIPDGETWLLVSSNGVMRFSPYILGNYEDFCATHDIKVPTGGVCIFDCVGDHWRCTDWGIKAYKLFK